MLMRNEHAIDCLEFCISHYQNLIKCLGDKRPPKIEKTWFDEWIWDRTDIYDFDELDAFQQHLYENKIEECVAILNRIKYNQANMMTFQENVPDLYFQIWMKGKL